MRRPLLATTTALTLVLVSAGGIAAQEASPLPSPEASPNGTEAQGTTEPLPVSDYWRDWVDHTSAVQSRTALLAQGAKRAGKLPKKAARLHREAVAAASDELTWLANRRPQTCYRAAYEEWGAAVEELRAAHEQAAGAQRRGKAKPIRRALKAQAAAQRRMDRIRSAPSDCLPSSAIEPAEQNPIVGSWATKVEFVASDGFSRPSRSSLTIDGDGRFIYRDQKNVLACYESGFGTVPLSWKGAGEFATDDRHRFHAAGRSACHPRKGPARRFRGELTFSYFHDEGADILYIAEGANCWWRKEGGSPKDCKAFWRGAQPASDEMAARDEDATASDKEATATPGEGDA